jgi:quercetin dioxygenase-like cupin family protein
MHVPHADGRTVYEEPGATGLQLLETETETFVELTVRKGGNVPAHSLDLPVTFYVAEGNGEISVDGRESLVAAGDMVTSEPGTTREVTNTGQTDLKLLVIKHKS